MKTVVHALPDELKQIKKADVSELEGYQIIVISADNARIMETIKTCFNEVFFLWFFRKIDYATSDKSKKNENCIDPDGNYFSFDWCKTGC